MSMILIAGIILAGIPFALIVGFAGYIFMGFINDDKDARGILNVALVMMAIGIVMILVHVATKIFIVTP